MSLCDSCFAPGACCKGFILNTWWAHAPDLTKLEVLARLACADPMEDPRVGLPFIPVERRAVDGYWTFECVLIGADGRCTEYETRPQLCRDFEPGSDRLCVHWRGAEAGEA